MRLSDKAIVLQAIRHGDKKYILKLYTRGHGLLTVAAAAGKSPSSKVRPAALLPLSLLNAELIVRENHEIHRLTEASVYYVNENIGTSVARLAVAQFLNEVLIKTLKEQQANPPLYDFTVNIIQFLNEAEGGYQNLPLHFLLQLARQLGFEPHNNFSAENPFFDCREGQFTPMSLSFPLGLNREDSRIFSEFLGADVLRTRFARDQRQVLLDTLLALIRCWPISGCMCPASMN
jgi:DNA repair protein RecO (recombination protein O)